MHISYIIQIGGLDENVQKRTLEMAAIVFLLNTDLKTSNASSKYNPVKVLLWSGRGFGEQSPMFIIAKIFFWNIVKVKSSLKLFALFVAIWLLTEPGAPRTIQIDPL